MSNKCLFCQKEAEIRVSFYEGGEAKSFYVCKSCAEYVAYRFFYLDKEIKKMEMERKSKQEGNRNEAEETFGFTDIRRYGFKMSFWERS
jgi:protein-arginine kinase activator protein McsA